MPVPPLLRIFRPELPPRSEYRITELGASLLPIIDSMLRWGEEHIALFEKKYACQKTVK
ncbi:MAG: helix-turn-helix transcriptional regulator [Alistipes sp.]|nr:helix-turn-helix transcriptional regulator [Alistipes sp.]